MGSIQVAGKFIAYNVGATGCWIVTNYRPMRHKNGRVAYYNVRIGPGSLEKAYLHRLIYEQERGPIGQYLIRHMCNDGLCINPQHLEIGTYQDNSNDAMDANAYAKDECRNGHDLTVEGAAIKRVRNASSSGKNMNKVYTYKQCRICMQEREYTRRSLARNEKSIERIEAHQRRLERIAEVERLRKEYGIPIVGSKATQVSTDAY